MKNYPHNVIRLRKGKRKKGQTYWIIAILNKKQVRSLKIIYKLGYIRFEDKGTIAINFEKLSFFLNKGFIMKKSVKKLVALLAYNTSNTRINNV